MTIFRTRIMGTPLPIHALWICALLALGVTGYVRSSADAREDAGKKTYEHLELFAEILTRVQSDYVEDVAYTEMIEAAIGGMLTSLDPHSAYLDPDALADMQVQASGQYGGVGIEVTWENGRIKIITPMDDSPASRANLLPGDYISAVDGEDIGGLGLSEAVKKMRGPAGKEISLTILRKDTEPFIVTLNREVIRPESVRGRLIDDIAYVRLSSFNERTGKSLEKTLRDLFKSAQKKPAGLILDVRNNPGGLLDQAVFVSGLFLKGGEVVSTRGRRDGDVQRYNAKRGEMFADVPMVVLINIGSASAAEIVAGALQDRQRASIIGTTSFGKGSVQTIIPLGVERGAIRLTISRYYTPSGRSIQGAGIEPDVEVAARRLSDEELKRITALGGPRIEASLHNALDNEQGIKRRPLHIPDDQPPLDYEGDDYQLDRAVEYLRKNAATAQSGRAG